MSNKLLGIDIFRVDTVAQHELGIIVSDVRGGAGGPVTIKQFIDDPVPIIKEYSPDGEYKYVRASSAIAIGDAVMVDTAATDEPAAVAPTTGVTIAVEGIAIIAIPLNSFGWIQVRGRVPSQAAGTSVAALRYGAKMAAAGAANDVKVASATAGTLATSGGTAAEDSNRGRVIRQLDAAIDDGSTTQFRGEVYIY
jgi:hypothetical protein